MNSIDRLRSRFEEWKDDPDFIYEGLVLDFTEQVVRNMIATGTRRSELAERLGTSRAYVTKLLDGQENMTLKTIVRVANALDLKVDLKLRPRNVTPRTKRVSVKTARPKTSSTKKRAVASRAR
jgi:plasmid maintenance system antidote protein VapI